MNEFLKSILKKATETVAEIIVNSRPRISNPKITRNNTCETVYEGSFNIPEGTTAVVSGHVVSGYLGGGIGAGTNGVRTLVGDVNFSEGTYAYTVDLGNSGRDGISSFYKLDIVLSNGETATKNFQRTSFNSSLYDTAPC